jgi:probable HAF family extracellular repeat protein
VNGRGQAVGVSVRPDGAHRAVLWDPGAPARDLGTLGGDWSVAHAINEAGQVVGSSATADGATRAFLWEDGRAMTALPPLEGYAWSAARDINDAGAVVGTSASPGADFFRRSRAPAPRSGPSGRPRAPRPRSTACRLPSSRPASSPA